jgi:hypothetical protein
VAKSTPLQPRRVSPTRKESLRTKEIADTTSILLSKRWPDYSLESAYLLASGSRSGEESSKHDDGWARSSKKTCAVSQTIQTGLRELQVRVTTRNRSFSLLANAQCRCDRHKKAKCDSVRPSCGFCSRLRQTCQYASPDPSQTAPATPDMVWYTSCRERTMIDEPPLIPGIV